MFMTPFSSKNEVPVAPLDSGSSKWEHQPANRMSADAFLLGCPQFREKITEILS
jgi:hypothetical protein